jgi:tetratricopeptide (TPR) repeat protein
MNRTPPVARAGDANLELFWTLCWVAAGNAEGPTPVPEVLATCEEIWCGFPFQGSANAYPLAPIGLLRAMQGRFEEARSLSRAVKEAALEWGHPIAAAARGMTRAWIEWLAGDYERAEEELRPSLEILEGYRELVDAAALLARVLYERGYFDEAHRLTRVYESSTDPHDLVPQITWRGVRANLLWHRVTARRLSTWPVRRWSWQSRPTA